MRCMYLGAGMIMVNKKTYRQQAPDLMSYFSGLNFWIKHQLQLSLC